jgi:hypothetical protein
MISVSNAFSSALERYGKSIDIINKIYLYCQYENEIIGILSWPSPNGLNTVVVSGDATSLFVSGDYLLIPLDDFETEYIIETISYISGTDRTNIELNGTMTTDMIGKTIAKRYIVSNKLISDGISRLVEKIEGESLGDFDSGQLDFVVDNSDGYFRNKEETGLFDGNDVFWVKYLISIAGIEETILRFGGILSNTRFYPNLYDKTITFSVDGHSKELERYPAWFLANFDRYELNLIPGIEISGYTNSDESEEGVKNVEYRPFGNSKMKGITVESVSHDTDSGIKKLEFRFPSYFRWDNGAWYRVAQLSDTDGASGKKKLYAKDGVQYAVVVFGDDDELTEYPDGDIEKWVSVKDIFAKEGGHEITEEGQPTIIFDHGAEETIRMHFQRVLKLASGSYSDVSNSVNLYNKFEPIEIFESNSDCIILVSPERFWGTNITLQTMFSSGDFIFEYSIGGGSFAAAMTSGINGLSDGTSNFTQSGKVTWNVADNWTSNYITIDNNIFYKGFMLRIRRVSATGTCKVYEVKHLVRAKGENGDFLEVIVHQDRLLTDNIVDEVIMKNESGAWAIGTWYDNIPFDLMLKKLLDIASYTSTKRTLAPMKFSFDSAHFNIWGKPPKLNYKKLPSDFIYDSVNDIAYVINENELWKCELNGIWTFLTELDVTDDSSATYKAKEMHMSGGVLYIVMGTDLRDKRLGSDAGADLENYKCFSYNISTGLLTENPYYSDIYPLTKFRRHGMTPAIGSAYRMLGQESPQTVGLHYGGENICIPFPQVITSAVKNPTYLNKLYRRPDLYDGDPNEPAEFGFLTVNLVWYDLISGRTYVPSIGYYALFSGISQCPEFYLQFSLGNQGVIIAFNDGQPSMFKKIADEWDDEWYRLLNLFTGNYYNLGWYNETQLPSCHCRNGNNLFFGFTRWNDVDVNNSIAYSYLTKANPFEKAGDWDKVYRYDGSYNDETTNANNGTDFNAFEANGDILYLGSSNKFRQAYIQFSLYQYSYTWAYEYWNGSAWTALENIPQYLHPQYQRVLTFDLPTDWETTDINSQDLFWVRIRAIDITNETIEAYACQLREKIVWDSENDNAGAYKNYVPVQLVYNSGDNVVHGCMFNKDSSGIDSYKWIYFVYDDNNGVVYFQNSGDNYTFDGSFLYKDFIYDTYNGVVYNMAENIRYKDRTAYLVKAEYNSGTNSITLTKVGAPVEGEWGSQCRLVTNYLDGSVYGISKGEKYKFWEYSNEFYPRIEIASFDNSVNFKTILSSMAKIMNCCYAIKAKRFIKVVFRDSAISESDTILQWDKHLVISRPEFTNWKHFYDAIIVNYENLIYGDSGHKKDGFTGWLKKALNINEKLIQNVHIADAVSVNHYNYFSALRILLENIKAGFLIHLELLDAIKIEIPSDIVDIDNSVFYLMTQIEINSDKNITLKGLEV